MMRVLLDTNIVLDYLLDRAPWADEAEAIWQTQDRDEIHAFVTATTMTNLFYAARKLVGYERAMRCVVSCLDPSESWLSMNQNCSKRRLAPVETLKTICKWPALGLNGFKPS